MDELHLSEAEDRTAGGIEPPPEELAPPLRAPSVVQDATNLPLPPTAPAPDEIVAAPLQAPPVQVTDAHLVLGFLSGLMLVLGMGLLLVWVFLLANPRPDPVSIVELATVETGKRVRLVPMTVVSVSATNRYGVPAPEVVLTDRSGHKISLLNTRNVPLSQGVEPYGLSARVVRTGHQTLLVDPFLSSIDLPGPIGVAGLAAFTLGLIFLTSLRRTLF